MILTVTLNPAVDKTCTVTGLMLGQVNRLQTVKSIAGGKGVNVTKVLRQFQIPVTAMGFLGGYSGRMISDAMERMGARCAFTPIQGDTRVNTNILAENGYVTELLEPGPAIGEGEIRSFLEEYERRAGESDIVVLSGSVPKGVPMDIYRKLTEFAGAMGKKVFLDAAGEALRMGVEAGPYLIKPNWREMEYLAGHKLAAREELAEAAKRLLDKGIRKVIISLGAEGILYVDRERILSRRAPHIAAVNTVGCGDTVVASYCMSQLEGTEPQEALNRAVALSAANATTLESANIPMDTYLALLQGM